MVESLKKSVKNVTEENVDKFVNVIQSSDSSFISTVKTIKKAVVIKKGSNVSLECRVNTGPVVTKTPVVFEPSVDQKWPEGIRVHAAVLTIHKGSSCRLQIPVTNTTDRDVLIYPRTEMGIIEGVRMVTPL